MTTCPSCGVAYPSTLRLCPADGTVLEGNQPAETRLVGAILDGKYRLDGFLSSGGMGAVFRATHVMLGKSVAVKVVRADLVTSPDMVRRFQREARAATSLHHPNIVAVHDLGQTDDGTLYIAMELVDGRSLKDEVRAQGRIPPARCVALMRQIAGALALAHRHQIIHRDLKPANVMLARDADGGEIAKLLDFGIAKTFDEATQLTVAGFALGTPQYMSPEQASGGAVDGRSDLYALGVMLYEMLVGEVPFTDASTPALLIKHVTEIPAPPSRRRPDLAIPADLEAIALTCLEKDPARRYQSAEALIAALDACDTGSADAPAPGALPPDASTRLVTPEPSPAAASSRTRPTVPAPGPPDAAAPRHRGGAFGAIAAVMLVIAAVGAALWLFSNADTRTAQTAAIPRSADVPAPPATPATALPAGPAAEREALDTPTELAHATARTPDPASGQGPAAPHGEPSPAREPGAAAALASRAARSSDSAAAPATAPSGGNGTSAATAPPSAPGPPPARVPPNPSVFVDCRGAAEVCGAVRSAFDQALEREKLPAALAPEDADVLLIVTARVIDERREPQFGQLMAIRTYAIEVRGEAPALGRPIPMAAPRTFSYDQRFGAERANEHARVVAREAAARVRAWAAAIPHP